LVIAADFLSKGTREYRTPGVTQLAHVVGAHAAAALALGLLIIQVNQWRLHGKEGWERWWQIPAVAQSEPLGQLAEAARWIRAETPLDSLVVANAFTQRNTREGRPVVVDGTTADKHYYFSALFERRMWIEGPAYLLNRPEAARRADGTNAFFYERRPLSDEILRHPTVLLVVDRTVGDSAQVAHPGARLVFRNQRFDVLRVDRIRPIN
jgi:hypothetical protein